MIDKKLKLRFEAVPFEDASEKYSIEGITLDDLSDLFPEDPESFQVHEGNVTIQGPMVVGYDWGKDPLTMYVIDGDLTIDGPLFFKQSDAYAGLFVTGNLTCESAYIAWTAQLFVGGSMTVKNLLATYIEDAGHFSIKGSLSAGSWLECGDRGCFEVGKKPKARLLRVGEHRYYVFGAFAPKDDATEAEDAEEDDEERKFGFSPKEAEPVKGIIHPSLLSDNDEDVDTDKLGEAIKKGLPLFADGSGGSTSKTRAAPATKKGSASKRAAPKKKPATKKGSARKRAPAPKQKPATKKPTKKKPPTNKKR